MTETAETPTVPPRRRRRRALSLRVMMLLVVAVAVPLAWVVREARQQREAVAEIERLGGEVFYDFQYSHADKRYFYEGQPRGPTWLRNWLGVDFFHHVTHVESGNLHGSSSSEFVRLLDRLTRVESLDLFIAGVTDQDVSRLARHESLRVLRLYGDPITDDGFAQLARLPQLRELDLTLTEITDAGIAALARCPRLEILELSGAIEISELSKAKITRAGIERLAEIASLRHVKLAVWREDILAGLKALRQIESLDVSFSPDPSELGLRDTSALFACLGALPHLRCLEIEDIIGDQDLAALAELQGLEHLDLSATMVTGAGLPHLLGMRRLNTLRLSAFRVTAAGIASLRAAAPGLKITQVRW